MFLKKYPASTPFPRQRRLMLQAAGCLLAMVLGIAPAAARQPLRVVATFSILGDMVKEIGGERVALTVIVGPNTDAHGFEPTPKDAEALREASVLVLNGLDFEGWVPRLVKASGFKGQQVLASEGVKVRRLSEPHDDHDDDKHHGDSDPHAWQDLANGVIYARNIAAGLSRADPRNASYYESRAAGYITRIKTLDNEVRTAISAIPQARRRVITTHDAFGYFGAAYGIEFIPVTGLSSQAEPSARDVARVIKLAREKHVSGVFIENMTSPRLGEQIAKESGAIMGGTLYADALGPTDEPAATYLGMMSWNAGRLVYVLKKAME